MIVGAHVSAAGGLEKAVERAAELGCNAVQVFTGSPRVWKGKPVAEVLVDEYFKKYQEHKFQAAVIHASYLVNLASDNPELVEKSVGTLVNDLQICAKAKMDGVVVHLGSHQGRGFEAMKVQLVEKIQEILAQVPESAMFLIENSAGQNGKIGSKLEEIAELIELVADKRLGLCMDTCHAHAAGYRLGQAHVTGTTGQGDMFGESDAPLLVAEIERLGLGKTLRCVHVNESRDPFGSGRDRHANLGEGEIGLATLAELVHQSVIEKLPLMLEVPGFDGKGPDKKNVDTLKSL